MKYCILFLYLEDFEFGKDGVQYMDIVAISTVKHYLLTELVNTLTTRTSTYLKLYFKDQR